MVDYSEGYLNLKQIVDEIWEAMMANDPIRARDPVSYTHLTLPTIYSV